MTTFAVGSLVVLTTDDTFNTQKGEILELLPSVSTDDFLYRIRVTDKYTKKTYDTVFRPSEVALDRDQPLTNHGAF